MNYRVADTVVDVKLQHLDSDIRRCDALEIMTIVYERMTCKNSTVECIALAATLGLQFRIPLTPPPQPNSHCGSLL